MYHFAPQRTRAVYDRFAARYDCVMAPLERWLLRDLRKRLFGMLPSSGLLLEVGAGTGANFSYYPSAVRGVATELSRAMLQIAARKERPAGLRLVQNSAERLPFADNSFDAAVATLVFCSVASPTEGFTELRRVVKPGGSICLLEHVRPDGALGYAFDALSRLTVALSDDHFNRRTADEARRAGLDVIGVERRAAGIIQLIVCRSTV